MINIVNTSNTDQNKTSLSAQTSSVSALHSARNAATTGNSADYTNSFQDTLNTAIDFSSLVDLEVKEDVNGNILPVLDNSSELTEQADRSILAASVDAVSESDEHVINLQDSILVNSGDVATTTTNTTLLSQEVVEPISTGAKGQTLTDTDSPLLRQSHAQSQAQVLPLQPEKTVQTLTKEVTNTGVSPSNKIHSLINKTAVDVNNLEKPVLVSTVSTESESIKKQTLETSSILFSNKTSVVNKLTVQSTVNQIQDNLPLSATEIDVNAISSDELNQLTAAVSRPNTLDESTKIGFSVNLPSYLRPLIDSRSATAKVTQAGFADYSLKVTTNAVTSNTVTNNAVIDSAMTQSSEVLNMSAEYNMLAEKNITLANLANQQPLSSALQTSPLLQTAVANPQLDGLAVTSNSSVSNLSSINTPALSQGEISVAFGRTTWSQGMGKQILNMVNQNIGTAEIRLNPAHLGPIEIMIDMSEDQVNVSLSSRHAVVREAMEQALPRLREMLDENGFNLADTDISKHSFAEQRQQNENNKPDLLNNINENIMTADVSESVIKQGSIETGSVDCYV